MRRWKKNNVKMGLRGRKATFVAAVDEKWNIYEAQQCKQIGKTLMLQHLLPNQPLQSHTRVFSPTVNGAWSCWSSWSQCSVGCGGGHYQRTRSCNSPSPANTGDICLGLHTEEALCNTHPCDGRSAPQIEDPTALNEESRLWMFEKQSVLL